MEVQSYMTKSPVMILFVTLMCFLAYSNSLTGEFQFDDGSILMYQDGLRNISDFEGMKNYFVSTIGTNRLIGSLTFVANYYIGGREAFWYHIINLLIHILNGLLVYHLLNITMQSPELSASYQRRGRKIALLSAALFLLHPVQTQTVSYISQRYESLSSFFYLGCVALYISAAGAEKPKKYIPLYIVSGISFILAVGSKEIAITAPFIIILYDLFFLRKRPLLKRLAVPFAFLLITAVSGFYFYMRLSIEISAGFNLSGITMQEYLLTQFRAVSMYIRLLFFPVNQNLDYAFSPSRSLFETDTFLSFLFILAILAAAIFSIRRWKCGSFFIFWFFIILSPTSSIIPIVDPINEHRVYLASLGIFVVISDALSRAMDSPNLAGSRIATILSVIVLILFSAATHQRNFVWKTPVSLWEDVVRKSPLKARTHYNLGNAYASKKLMDKAAVQYQIAISLEPAKSNAYNNLANCYIYLGRHNEAIEVYKSSIASDKNNYEAYHNLGMIYYNQGAFEDAARYLRIFVDKAPQKFNAQKEIAIKSLAVIEKEENKNAAGEK